MKKQTPHSARCGGAYILSSSWIHRPESWGVQERGRGGGGGGGGASFTGELFPTSEL